MWCSKTISRKMSSKDITTPFPGFTRLAHVISTAPGTPVHHIEALGKLRMLKICQEVKGPVVTKEQ